MIDCKKFYDLLRRDGVNFFAGVPDSALKGFCQCVMEESAPSEHLIAANEGGAVGIAIGRHLATGELPLVYMQNSGQGISLNPVLSLCDPAVYSVPLLLLVGWRGGAPGPDEPQHNAQGAVTEAIFETAGIPVFLLSEDWNDAQPVVKNAIKTATDKQRPVAVLVRPGVFAPHDSKRQVSSMSLTREDVVCAIAERIAPDAVLVATTGKAGRELYECRERRGEGHERDFLCVGGMGHASQIALGVAMSRPERMVCCLDGDGAALMHLGSIPIIGSRAPGNFKHLILNNGSHESVGGQPTVGFSVDFCAIAKASGYEYAESVELSEDLDGALVDFISAPGPSMLVARLKSSSRSDLGRPTIECTARKTALMDFLNDRDE